MTKIKVHSFYVPIFEKNVSFLVGGEFEDFKKHLENKHGKDYEDRMWSYGEQYRWEKDADGTDAYTVFITERLGIGEVFYTWAHEPKPSLMWHEVKHMTHDILIHCGAKYCYESDEVFCYLGGWIFEKIYIMLNGKLKWNK